MRPTPEHSSSARGAPIPVGNLLALAIPALVAFFLGLLEALERLPYAPTLRLGEIGLAIALLVGAATVLGGRGRLGERILVSLLRAGLGGGVFVFVFEGMRLFLKIGAVGGALGSWVCAGILGLLLARLAPARSPTAPDRDPGRATAGQWSASTKDAARPSPAGRPAKLGESPLTPGVEQQCAASASIASAPRQKAKA